MARPKGSTSEVTGPRIRAAAVRLFARHGFAAVTMRQIAAEVGLQAGALYLYAADKEDLLFDLLRTHMEQLIAAYDGAGQPAAPLPALESFVRFHLKSNLEHPDAVFLSYMELRSLGPDNFARIEALRRAYEDRLSAILSAGQAAGVLSVPDVRLATMAIIALLNGVNTWYREGGRLTHLQVSDIHWDMVRRAFALPGAT